ncbi:MAG: DeoR/GlpR family DNA-binding transcription regulator [Anaerolineae bacterium]|nr:DeoR/GlpR family DNA-binding transcription regulator [Anaerolineae bacterium]
MTEKLFPAERLDQIAGLLQQNGRVSVAGLQERYGVSAVTIRNDLATLERQGLLVRTHGGAVTRPSVGMEPLAFALRKELHLAQKERIGRSAAALVRDGDSIALDASTTAWQVARHLKDRRELTVVTNGLFIALEFVDSPGVTVVMPGGQLRAASASLVGSEGASILDRYHVQRGFFGGGGFTLEEGLTDTNQYEVELKQRMLARSKEVIAIVDSSKWGEVTFAPLASVGQLDRVITDEDAPTGMVAALRDQGIDVIVV